MCAACKQPIRDAYYSAKGKTFCAGCKAKIEAALAREGNFGRGLLFGLGGAVPGGIRPGCKIAAGSEPLKSTHPCRRATPGSRRARRV
jgi:hypothetical protein